MFFMVLPFRASHSKKTARFLKSTAVLGYRRTDWLAANTSNLYHTWSIKKRAKIGLHTEPKTVEQREARLSRHGATNRERGHVGANTKGASVPLSENKKVDGKARPSTRSTDKSNIGRTGQHIGPFMWSFGAYAVYFGFH